MKMGDALSLIEGDSRELPHEAVALIAATATAKRPRRKKAAKYRRETTYKTREQICRDVLETATRLEWPSVRPKWLIGEHGRSLEIDCFCERLSTALECNGTYHSRRLFWQTGAQFEQTRRNDTIKARLLQKLGFLLIIVPSREQLGDHAIPKFIIEQLATHRVYHRKAIVLPV